jgi:hypothetical protein
MAMRHCQWRCANVLVSLVCLYKDATESDVFQFFFNLEWSDASGKNATLIGVECFF